MSQLESLFLVVLVIYLAQCLHWVTPGAAVFVLRIRGRGKRKRGGFVWSALKLEGFLASPFPPLSPLTAAAWPAFQLDPDGIAFPESEGESLFLPWEKVNVTRSDSRLLCNGKTAFRGSEAQVLACFTLLQQLRSAARPQRETMLGRWLRQAMNARRVARRLEVFSRRLRWLRVLVNLQFFFLFFVAPFVFARTGTTILWRVILFLLGLSLLIALEFWTAHRKLYPQGGSSRLKAMVTIVLSPVAAIRACDVLARDLLAGSHPVAVAGGLLEGEEFDEFAGEQLRLCQFAGQPDKWYQRTLAGLMSQAIKQAGTRPDTLLRPAERQEGCVAYCPRCLSQYVKDTRSCADCGFDKLVPFKGAAARTLKRGGTD